MGDADPLIAVGIAIATVVSMLAAGSVMVGDALSGSLPW